jgi:hypothetical protein
MNKNILKTSCIYVIELLLITGMLASTFVSCSSAGESGASESGLEVYIIKPITSQKILPDTPERLYPFAGKTGEKTIFVKACRGEFEPASFVIRAGTNVSGISIVSSDLKSPSGRVITSSAIDVRIVKCWYQAGTSVAKGEKVLVPELLLKDDTLVKVDETEKMNYLRVKVNNVEKYIDITSSDARFPLDAEIHDARTLLPFNIPANTNKQIWLTIHVPGDAESEQYIGNISLYEGKKLLSRMKIALTVLPFDLEKPAIDYGIYYTPILVWNTYGKEFSSLYKSTVQYKIELQNMKDHGVLYPTLYQGYSDIELLRKALEIRNSVNLPKDKLYTMAMGLSTDYSSTDRLAWLPGYISTWRKLVSEYNYVDFYIYGIDEAKGDTLKVQQRAWQITHNAGAKIFAACYEGAVDTAGDLLDLPILSGVFKPVEVEKWHKHGKKVFIYGYPQVGNEDPEIYRRNFGITALCNGYDGAMDFAYQYAFESANGHIWNDFNNTTGYRNHVFAYPTTDGVIDTVQWEGFREAVEDVRYLTTLAKARNTADYQSLCRSLSTNNDLYSIRQSIIDRIISGTTQPPISLQRKIIQ